MNKIFIFVILLLITIPISYAKTMDTAKEISVNDSHGSILINGSFSSIIKDDENITVVGYESGVIGNIRITTNVENIRLLNATSNSLAYTQYGADTHLIYLPSKNNPIVHGGLLLSYMNHISEISTTGLSDIILTWLNAGMGLSISFILLIFVLAGAVSLFMALKSKR